MLCHFPFEHILSLAIQTNFVTPRSNTLCHPLPCVLKYSVTFYSSTAFCHSPFKSCVVSLSIRTHYHVTPTQTHWLPSTPPFKIFCSSPLKHIFAISLKTHYVTPIRQIVSLSIQSYCATLHSKTFC